MKNSAIGLLAVLFILCGCASEPTIKMPPDTSTARIKLTDLYTRAYLQFGNQSVEFTPDSRLSIYVDFANRLNQMMHIQTMVVFKNAQGREVERTNWQLINIQQNDSYSFTQSSLNDQAADFVIRIRKAE